MHSNEKFLRHSIALVSIKNLELEVSSKPLASTYSNALGNKFGKWVKWFPISFSKKMNDLTTRGFAG